MRSLGLSLMQPHDELSCIDDKDDPGTHILDVGVVVVGTVVRDKFRSCFVWNKVNMKWKSSSSRCIVWEEVVNLTRKIVDRDVVKPFCKRHYYYFIK